MFSKAFLTVLPTFALLFATPIAAQHADHSDHSGHVMSDAAATALPTEPGDSAFAAIAEIVAMLSDDPETDWSRVDIDGLREHLVDMNQLVLGASVRSEHLPDGLIPVAERSDSFGIPNLVKV